MKILSAIFILFFGYSLAAAHSCRTFSRLEDKDHSEELQKVNKIFYGEIISISGGEYHIYLIKFRVIRAWKGVESNEITAKFGNPCGIALSVGEKKIVYGYDSKEENIIDVNCCNFGLFDDERMKREFGEGKVFEEAAPPVEQSFWTKLWNKIVSFFS